MSPSRDTGRRRNLPAEDPSFEVSPRIHSNRSLPRPSLAPSALVSSAVCCAVDSDAKRNGTPALGASGSEFQVRMRRSFGAWVLIT